MSTWWQQFSKQEQSPAVELLVASDLVISLGVRVKIGMLNGDSCDLSDKRGKIGVLKNSSYIIQETSPLYQATIHLSRFVK